MKILSVSVASYNLGKMIETNIKSFVSSPIADKIELIITDDGSKDNTPEIIEEFQKKYPNIIKFIKKQNEGPGSTVNSGIKNATGKYFRMVDGDDWVNTQNLTEYVNFLEQIDADMVVSNYDIYDNSLNKIIETKKFNLPENQVFDFNKFYKDIPNQMHAITYRTNIFKENNLVLDNCFYTDVEYVLLAIPFVKTVGYFNKTIYIYRVAQANQSVSPASMTKNIAQHELVLNRLINLYNQNKATLTPEQNKFIVGRLGEMAGVNLYTLLLFEPSKQNKQRVKDFYEKLKTHSSEIYVEFLKGKKAKALKLTKFLLYNIISKIVRKGAK